MRRGRFLGPVAVLAAVLAMSGAALAAAPQSLFSKNAIQQGYGGVGSQTQPAQLNTVAGANKTIAHAAPGSVAGTLPFTGLQLGVFAAIGLTLVAGGMLLHRIGRGRSGS